MKMKKGGLLLKFMSMILVIFLVTPMVLELGIVASFASTYYKKYQKDEGVYIYDDIQGSLSVTYRVYGHFYEESYGGLYAEGDMDTTETVKVPITVSVSRSYNPNSKYEDMRYKYTYDIKAQSVDGNWSAQDYTVAPGLDHDLGSWVLANGSVTASVPKISQWEGKYASTDYDKSIPISEKINTDGVSMSVSSFKDMNPDWFVKDDWYSLNVNVLKANVEFEIPAFTQLTVKWDEGVSTVYDYWSQHNHSDLGELVNGGKYLYQKGDRAYTFINLKEGYDFDYIGEGSNDLHWTDSKWNTTENRWENSWSMANDREIYIHTKKQIKTLNLSWDSGVNMVIGHSTEGSDMQMPNGSDVCYYYGTTAPAWIYLNSGYDIDYIEDLDSHEKIYVSSSDWSEDNSRYDKYFEMKQNRKLKIHTKPKTYTFLQEVYMRFQNEDGSWDDWDAWDGYSYASKEEYDDHFGNPLSSIVSDGSKYTFDTSMITDDFRWNSDAYEMPEEFDDGTEFSYTVTSSNTRYISVKRKTKYIMSFDRGLTDDDSQQMDNITVGEYTSFKLPVNLYKGRSYSVNFNSNGGSNINPINGNLNYDDYCNWKDDYKGNLWGDEEEFNSQYVDNNIIFTMQWESEDITLPTPTKSDYIFGGWYEDKAYTKKVNGNTITIEPDTTHLDVTLYAKWTKEAPKTAYLKTFSGKGISGTNYATGGNINIGTEVTVTATVKTGYKFVNWTDGSSNEKSTDKDYKFTMPANDVNLTANATPIKYNIVFNSNKPSSATSSVTGSTASMNNIAYDTSITLNKNGYSLSGWKFVGWNTKADGSGTSYTDGQSVNNLTTTDGATITMYAKWVQGDGDLVTANKGTGISDTTGTGTYKDGASVSLGAIVATGYTWKANESTTGWFDSTGKKISSNQNYKFTMTPGAKTYTAKATANTYTIKYNKNKSDATGTITDSAYTYDVKGTLRTNVFTATGYKQTGWNTKADGTGTHYDAGKAIDVINWTDLDGKVINLYAEWEKQSYAVTYIDVVNNKNGKELGRTTKQISYGSKVSGSDIGTDKTLGTYYDGYVYESCTSATVETSGTVVYRIFKVHNYNISYNLNGGSLPDGKSNPDTYNVESSDITLNNPVKSGYVFTGWSGTDITGVSTKVTIAKGSTGDRTYVANWKAAEYTIRYTRGNTDVVKEYIDQKVTYDSDVITKPGNTFTGRTYSITYDQGYTNNREWEKTSLPSDITNAHLTFKSWSISGREYNAGIKLTKPNFVTNGTVIATADWNTADIKLTGVTRAGYTFTGWKCSEDGNIYAAGTTYRINPGTTALNITFTAQWTANKDTKYVVRHWKQKLYLDGTKKYADGSRHDTVNYFLADTDNLTGTTDTLVKPSLKSYEGFTSPSVQTVKVKGDGSLIVDYYYTRNKYKIDDGDKKGGSDGGSDTDSDKGNGIEDITGGGEYYYEEEVTMEAAVKKGYHWHIDDDCHTDRSKYPTGWKVTKAGCGIDKFIDNTSYATQKIKFIMPSHDVCVKADATNNSYTIKFDNNGGTGNMQEVAATYKVPVTLPVNTFTRTTNFGESRFLYWEDRKNDVTYLNNATVTSLTDEFNGIVTLYASWDDCPEITAQERWFTVDDSQNGKITLEELLSTAKVTDDRDSDIEEKLTVKYYQPNLFTQFKTDGYVMVTYTATDSSNNTTEVTVKVNIVDTVAVEQEKDTYARFIAPQYYKESYENGGLEDDSIWKKDPDYAATLERAMNNRESMHYEYIDTKLFGAPFRIRKQACEYSDHLLEKWVFTKDDIKAVKEYINEHGIGNLKEADALANFRIQFAHCRQQ